MHTDTIEECIKVVSDLKEAYRSVSRVDNSDICKALAIAEARLRARFPQNTTVGE